MTIKRKMNIEECLMKRFLIIDSDCFAGVRQGIVLDSVKEMAGIDSAFVVGKNSCENRRLQRLITSGLSFAHVKVFRSGPQKGATSAWCAFLLGIILGECSNINSDKPEVVLFSTKWIVPSFVPELAKRGIRVMVPESLQANKLKETVPECSILRLNKQNDVSSHEVRLTPGAHMVPDWVQSNLSPERMKIGFEVIAVPSQQVIPSPSFIPFPDVLPITIGSDAPSSIQLGVWDVKKGLYSPHVEINYIPIPSSQWHIRSLHGHRRGTKNVSVNGQSIQANTPTTSLKNGDEVVLGQFHFRFRTDRYEELFRYEEPYQLVKDIELRLKQIAESDQVDITDLVDGNDMLGNPIKSWKQVSWGQFEEILTKLWDKPAFQRVREEIESFDDLRALFNKVKNARNTVGHPIRGNLKLIQRRHVVELYQLLCASD